MAKAWGMVRAAASRRPRACRRMFFKQGPLVPLQTLSFLCGEAKSAILQFPGSSGPLQLPLGPATRGREGPGSRGQPAWTQAGGGCMPGQGELPPSLHSLRAAEPMALWNPGQAMHPAGGPMDAPGSWGPPESRTWKVSFRSHGPKVFNLRSVDFQAQVDEF